jgi:hypothetical protein
MNDKVIDIRTIDRKRLDSRHERTATNLDHSDVWYRTGCEFYQLA